MLNAVLHQGVIVPLQPLPQEWKEGDALEVAKAPATPGNIDAWAQTTNELCADASSGDQEIMRRAVKEHRRQAKSQVRREMGLPE